MFLVIALLILSTTYISSNEKIDQNHRSVFTGIVLLISVIYLIFSFIGT